MSGGLALHITVEHGPHPDRMALTRALVRWADVAGPTLRDLVREEAPVGQGPGAGRLRQQIRYQRNTSVGSVALKILGGAPYTGFVLHGTQPHVILPRHTLALHWTSGGADHFATIVHHPGTQPNPFGQRALDRGRIGLSRTLAVIMGEELAR